MYKVIEKTLFAEALSSDRWVIKCLDGIPPTAKTIAFSPAEAKALSRRRRRKAVVAVGEMSRSRRRRRSSRMMRSKGKI